MKTSESCLNDAKKSNKKMFSNVLVMPVLRLREWPDAQY